MMLMRRRWDVLCSESSFSIPYRVLIRLTHRLHITVTSSNWSFSPPSTANLMANITSLATRHATRPLTVIVRDNAPLQGRPSLPRTYDGAGLPFPPHSIHCHVSTRSPVVDRRSHPPSTKHPRPSQPRRPTTQTSESTPPRPAPGSVPPRPHALLTRATQYSPPISDGKKKISPWQWPSMPRTGPPRPTSCRRGRTRPTSSARPRPRISDRACVRRPQTAWLWPPTRPDRQSCVPRSGVGDEQGLGVGRPRP